MKLLELREKRMSLVKEAQDILTAAPAEGMSGEDNKRFDGLMAEADVIKGQVDRAERADAESREIESAYRPAVKPDGRAVEADEAAEKRAHNGAFTSYLRYGMAALSGEQRKIMENRFAGSGPEKRAFTETTTGGGYLIPQDFYRKLTEAYKFFGGMRQSGATVIQTATGATMPFPSVNDTAVSGSILGINTGATLDVTTPFGSVSLSAWTYSSNIVQVPMQLAQDSAFDLDSFLARMLGIRIGRITNNHYTVGTGSSQPRGVVIDAVSGKVGLTGQTLTVIYDDLVDLEHSVDPAYRPQSRFMLHDSSLKVMKKIKDTTGRPLWRSGLEGLGSVGSDPDTLNGYPYIINNDVAVMAANAKSILFGDFSNYVIRDVQGVEILRLTERYADALQIGYLAFARSDGALIDAGTHPVAYYANSAT